jgi:hypothetical protein
VRSSPFDELRVTELPFDELRVTELPFDELRVTTARSRRRRRQVWGDWRGRG